MANLVTNKKTKNNPKKLNFNLFRAFGIVALAGIITVSTIFLAQRYWQDNTKKEAKASSSVTLYPGQTGNFNITYTNGGDSDSLPNAILNVFVGSELVIDPTSITDTFNGGQTFPVNPSVIISTDATNGTKIKYRPGTANVAGTPSGLNTPGDIVLPPDKNGILSFKATLKADTLTSGRTQVGVVYNYVISDNKQGIYSILQFTGNGSVPGSVDLVVANAPAGSSSSSSSIVSSVASSSISSLVSSSTISSSISSSIVSSSSISSSISSVSSSSSLTPTSFGCIGGINAPNDCRIYFIGTNGAALNWDGTTKFNNNYPDTQKWRDGTVKLVFDNIKRSDNSLISNGSNCTFNIYRYTQNQVLKSISTTTSNGLCQVDFPTNLQGTNYYTIIASATDKNDSQLMKGMDRLVLYVGGIGNRNLPVVEI